jgi:hypothetical protein
MVTRAKLCGCAPDTFPAGFAMVAPEKNKKPARNRMHVTINDRIFGSMNDAMKPKGHQIYSKEDCSHFSFPAFFIGQSHRGRSYVKKSPNDQNRQSAIF